MVFVQDGGQGVVEGFLGIEVGAVDDEPGAGRGACRFRRACEVGAEAGLRERVRAQGEALCALAAVLSEAELATKVPTLLLLPMARAWWTSRSRWGTSSPASLTWSCPGTRSSFSWRARPFMQLCLSATRKSSAQRRVRRHRGVPVDAVELFDAMVRSGLITVFIMSGMRIGIRARGPPARVPWRG